LTNEKENVAKIILFILNGMQTYTTNIGLAKIYQMKLTLLCWRIGLGYTKTIKTRLLENDPSPNLINWAYKFSEFFQAMKRTLPRSFA